VSTVFDLFVGHLGIQRERDVEAKVVERVERAPNGPHHPEYDELRPHTPAWQESLTGVPRSEVIRVAREFASNAERSGGRSMILIGSGVNHWFHSDETSA
jgi:nitrate reductase alpha subunit